MHPMSYNHLYVPEENISSKTIFWVTTSWVTRVILLTLIVSGMGFGVKLLLESSRFDLATVCVLILFVVMVGTKMIGSVIDPEKMASFGMANEGVGFPTIGGDFIWLDWRCIGAIEPATFGLTKKGLRFEVLCQNAALNVAHTECDEENRVWIHVKNDVIPSLRLCRMAKNYKNSLKASKNKT